MLLFRILLPLLFVLAIDWYAFQAVKTIVAGCESHIENIAYWSYAFVSIAVVLAIVAFSMFRATVDLEKYRAVIIAIVIGVILPKLLISFFMLGEDVSRLMRVMLNAFFDAEFSTGRTVWFAWLSVCFPFLLFSLLIYGRVRNVYRYQVKRIQLSIPDLPEELQGFKIVQISDIHSGSLSDLKKLQKGVEKINSQQADIVFFTGDLVNNRASEMEGKIEIFKQVSAKHGVFSILGNHDYGDYVPWRNAEEKSANLNTLKSIHRELGWQLLLNENRALNIKGRQLAVIGVENWSSKLHFPRCGDLQKASAGTESADLKLLLSHDPTHWDAVVLKEFPDIAVTFSGHTHGAQFGFEFGKIRFSPVSFVYKRWAGLYREGKQFLYVNRGFGVLGYPGRVGILPEITVLELVGK